MNESAGGPETSQDRIRRGIWSRIRAQGLIGEVELIRVHFLAQKRGMDPLKAAVALGILREKQILDL